MSVHNSHGFPQSTESVGKRLLVVRLAGWGPAQGKEGDGGVLRVVVVVVSGGMCFFLLCSLFARQGNERGWLNTGLWNGLAKHWA